MSEIEKTPMSAEKRKQIEKLVVYLILGVIGLVVMWIIFAPSGGEDNTEKSQFNVNVPEAMQEELVTNKQSAYAKEKIKQRDEEREAVKTLAANVIEEREAVVVDTSTPTTNTTYRSSSSNARQNVTASTDAYRNLNKSLDNFNSTPKVDTEKEKMQKELDELKEQMARQSSAPQSMGVDEQIALMEKSYELAAKYNGQMAQQTTSTATTKATAKEVEDVKSYINGKAQLNVVGQVKSQVVTSLHQPISNLGFTTAVGEQAQNDRNTVSACIHSDQTVTDGQSVRIRITEPMQIGDKVLPASAIITGSARVQGERLHITISNIEHQGYILPVELTVVDSDGTEGIFIPNSTEINAIKEVVSNLGSSIGTTVNLTSQSAGDQILTELGKGAIQGVSQYATKKLQEVRVHLKAGYKVMLYQSKR